MRFRHFVFGNRLRTTCFRFLQSFASPDQAVELQLSRWKLPECATHNPQHTTRDTQPTTHIPHHTLHDTRHTHATHTHRHKRTRTLTCMYMYMYMHVYMCMCMHMYMYMYMHVYMCMCMHMYMCMYMHVYLCMKQLREAKKHETIVEGHQHIYFPQRRTAQL